jgi:hypothetical protein
MYSDQSLLTFEGAKCMGKAAIHAKLTEGVRFRTSRHRIQTLDAQPCCGGVLVFVGGEILVDEEERPIRFSQVFQLMPMLGAGGSYFIQCDLFRLHYG